MFRGEGPGGPHGAAGEAAAVVDAQPSPNGCGRQGAAPNFRPRRRVARGAPRGMSAVAFIVGEPLARHAPSLPGTTGRCAWGAGGGHGRVWRRGVSWDPPSFGLISDRMRGGAPPARARAAAVGSALWVRQAGADPRGQFLHRHALPLDHPEYKPWC